MQPGTKHRKAMKLSHIKLEKVSRDASLHAIPHDSLLMLSSEKQKRQQPSRLPRWHFCATLPSVRLDQMPQVPGVGAQVLGKAVQLAAALAGRETTHAAAARELGV